MIQLVCIPAMAMCQWPYLLAAVGPTRLWYAVPLIASVSLVLRRHAARRHGPDPDPRRSLRHLGRRLHGDRAGRDSVPELAAVRFEPLRPSPGEGPEGCLAVCH